MKSALPLVLLALIVITASGCGKKPGDGASAEGGSSAPAPTSKAGGDVSQKHTGFKGEWITTFDPTIRLVISADDHVELSLREYKADGPGRYDAKRALYTTQISPGKGGAPGRTFYNGTPEDFYIELRFAANTRPGEAPTHLNYSIYSMKYNSTAQEGTIERKVAADGKP
jgi:hypothetical protein